MSKCVEMTPIETKKSLMIIVGPDVEELIYKYVILFNEYELHINEIEMFKFRQVSRIPCGRYCIRSMQYGGPIYHSVFRYSLTRYLTHFHNPNFPSSIDSFLDEKVYITCWANSDDITIQFENGRRYSFI